MFARGPDGTVHRYGGYSINGYRFNTIEVEKDRRTQNSGIFSSFSQLSYASAKDQQPKEGEIFYYGQVEDIVEIFYGYRKEVSHVMFRVRWCEQPTPKTDDLGFTLVNLKKEICKHEKYMFASQAKQCFYAKDIMVDDVWVVLKNPPKVYVPNEEVSQEDNEDNNDVVLLFDNVVDEISTEQPNVTTDDNAPLRTDIPNLESPGYEIIRAEFASTSTTIRNVLSSRVLTRSQRALASTSTS